MIRLRVTRIHHPQIRIFSCTPRGHVRDLIAARRPRSRKVARLAVRQQRHVARGYVVAIELVPLSTANILRKKYVVAAIRMKPPAADGVPEKTQMLPCSSRLLHTLMLMRIP